MEFIIVPLFFIIAVKCATFCRRSSAQAEQEVAEAARHQQDIEAAVATQDARLESIFQPLWESIDRVHAKLDTILEKLD